MTSLRYLITILCLKCIILAGLLYLVYQETGGWTVTAFILIFIEDISKYILKHLQKNDNIRMKYY